ncbi:MAG: ArnT family glycosyltransferase [Bacillota bacterium]
MIQLTKRKIRQERSHGDGSSVSGAERRTEGKTMELSPWRSGREILYILFITALGIYLRIWWIKNIPTKPIFDFETYQEIATNIFHHVGHTYRGEPIAFQGMGYPTALGYFYRLMGNNEEWTAKVFNVILSSLTLSGTYFILLKLTKRKFVIYFSYTMIALLPNYIAYNNVISTEVFITFIFVAIILLQLYVFHNFIRYPLMGVFIGAAALTKPFFLAYPVVAAVGYWLREKELKKTGIMFAAVTLCMVLAVAPWTYRNYVKFGRFIPVSYNSGYVFYINNNANNTTGAWMPIKDIYASPVLREKIDEILEGGARSEKVAHELEVIFKPEAKKWIRNHPGDFVKVGLLRIKATFFSGAWDIDAWAMNEFKEKQTFWKKEVDYLRSMNAFRGLTDIIIYLISSFGLLYMIINIKNVIWGLLKKKKTLHNVIIIPTLNIGFFTAIYFVFEGQARYNFPVLFLLVIATGLCVDIIRNGLTEQEQ